MSKGKNRKKIQSSNNAGHASTFNLKTEIPKVNAAINNIKETGVLMDIPDFDENLAVKFTEKLPDDATELKLWLGRFADLGKQAKEKLNDLTKNQEKLEFLELELEERKEQLGKDQEELTSLKNELEPERSKLDTLRADLVKREREILSREHDAEHEFSKLNENMLSNLKQERSELVSELEKIKKEIAITKDGLHETILAKMAELDDIEIDLNSEKNKISRKGKCLDTAIQELDTERQELLDSSEAKLVRERQRMEQQLETERKRSEKAFSARDNMRDKLNEFVDFSKIFQGKSPSDLLEQLDEAKQEKQRLIHQISSSGQHELERENEALKQRIQAMEGRLLDIEPDYEKTKAELTRHRIATTEKQQLVETNKVLEKHKQVLGAHVNDLSTRIDQLTESQQAQNAFPALSKMDRDDNYQRSPHLDDVPNLEQFAPDLQRRIAYAESNVVLNYKLEDIQLLLGGLAMSQLHVFQGISGTGKTSLAKAFAKAMGGECITIPVQAGWRDRDDLLGYYNAFEKRFYEKDCLQGLYSAQTEAYKDRCNVILLDEMNLSRPEQYFSEFLSALEINDTSERLISLSESGLSNAPRLLKDGRKIKVPENLWFIGTANQDETTNELADKTYDRAHVMILPKHEGGQTLERIQSQKFSYSSLQKRFNEAQKRYESDVSNILEELQTGNLVTILEDKFDLGWGNRFEQQAKCFIPVVMSAGGSKEMALDHLLATRILRRGKTTGRYDTRIDDLQSVKNSLEQLWKNWDNEPVKCFDLLDKDIRQKENA